MHGPPRTPAQSRGGRKGSGHDPDALQEVSTEEGKFNEEDIYNAMTENMENISNYIDQIISKISYHRSDVK